MNNLVEHAVPKAIECLDIDETLNEQAKREVGYSQIFKLWLTKLYEIDNPILALYQAIVEIKTAECSDKGR